MQQITIILLIVMLLICISTSIAIAIYYKTITETPSTNTSSTNTNTSSTNTNTPTQNPTQNQTQKPEVFLYGVETWPYTNAFTKSQSLTSCPSGSVLASPAQLKEAQLAGAEWCSSAFINDGTIGFPMTSKKEGCGTIGVNIWSTTADSKANLNCYGIKPPKGTINVQPFNQNKWSINT